VDRIEQARDGENACVPTYIVNEEAVRDAKRLIDRRPGTPGHGCPSFPSTLSGDCIDWAVDEDRTPA
jgi:hypothetical protein